MSRVGYARVSGLSQDSELQVQALNTAGCARIYIERASGALTDRPKLAEALDYARAGDTLVVWKLDRLGRSLSHLIATVDGLRTQGVAFVSLTEAIDTATPQGQLLFHLLGAFAEFERALIRERILAGQAAARANGRHGGRPHVLTAAQVRYAKRMHDARVPVSEIAAGLSCGRSTVYRALLAHPIEPPAASAAA